MSERTAPSNKRILITGGTGSLGTALVERWHKSNDLTILSRNPHRQIELADKFGLSPGQFVLADICDYEAVKWACSGQDILIHAAALKIVSQGEQQPVEYHRVNTLGAQVVARAWIDTRREPHPDTLAKPYDPRHALYINSDKAVAPINQYGICKAAGERAFITSGLSSIRYGNVVESQGSFIHKWKRQIKVTGKVTLRRPEPTRFFLSINQAIDLIEDALHLMRHDINGVFVPHSLKVFSVYDVAGALFPPMNSFESIANFEPLQPGEKQHEGLLAEGEKATRVSDLLSLVESGREGLNGNFSSETAPKMDMKEFFKALGLSPAQKEFS